MSNPDDLKRKYSYMFSGQHIALSFYRGWHALLEQLCKDIDLLLGEDKRDFHWVQIKEKLGTIRLYWRIEDLAPATRLTVISSDGTSADFKIVGAKPRYSLEVEEQVLRENISTLIDEAEAATFHICMACGSPGKQRRFRGYIVTLCDEHARQRSKGIDPGYWFDASEGG